MLSSPTTRVTVLCHQSPVTWPWPRQQGECLQHLVPRLLGPCALEDPVGGDRRPSVSAILTALPCAQKPVEMSRPGREPHVPVLSPALSVTLLFSVRQPASGGLHLQLGPVATAVSGHSGLVTLGRTQPVFLEKGHLASSAEGGMCYRPPGPGCCPLPWGLSLSPARAASCPRSSHGGGARPGPCAHGAPQHRACQGPSPAGGAAGSPASAQPGPTGVR